LGAWSIIWGGAKPIKALPWRHDWFVMYLCEHFLSGTPHA